MKNPDIKITYESIKERFKFTREDLAASIEIKEHQIHNDIPTFGFPVSNMLIDKLYNLLMDNDIIIDADYISFAYYFNPNNQPPKKPVMIHWGVTTELFRQLFRLIFKPFVDNKECTYTELEAKCPLMFIDSKRKPLHPYSASSTSTKSPEYYAVKEIIATLFGDVTTTKSKRKKKSK